MRRAKSPKAAKTTRPKTRRRKFGPKSPRLATNAPNPVPSGGETEKSDCGASSKEIRGHKHKITETVYQNIPWGKSVFAPADYKLKFISVPCENEDLLEFPLPGMIAVRKKPGE